VFISFFSPSHTFHSRVHIVFPPFWLIGSLILFSRLRPTPEWEMGKTDEEKKFILDRMRSTEVKWAKRCLVAFVVLIVITIPLVAVLCVITTSGPL
jgi:hypothetical protein